jgi:hypothetical protein
MSKPERMRRWQVRGKERRDDNLLKVILLAGILVAKSGLAIGACTPAPSVTQTSTIQSSFWGMHVAAPAYLPWPTVPVGAIRTMGSWPGVAWANANPQDGVYDWTNLDAFVRDVSSHGQDILYSFVWPPSWTSYPSATNLEPWTKFVKAVVARYCNVIKYWELWNEPNASNFWEGSTEDMVEMARVAYPIIRDAGGVVLSPAPQGAYAYKWLDEYFKKGGAAFTDVVAFHGYTFDAPEVIAPLIKNVRNTMLAHGLSGKPLWDTEHSWGDDTWAYGDTPENQSKWLSRFVILEAALGINRSYWYMWDAFDYGKLFDRTTLTIREPGKVYKIMYNWLNGNAVSCTVSSDIYSCAVGASKAIYWHAKGWSSTITVDKKYTKTQNMYGVNGAISRRKVKISGIPVLVQ